MKKSKFFWGVATVFVSACFFFSSNLINAETVPVMPTATSTAVWSADCDYIDDGVIDEDDWDIFATDWGRTDCASTTDICECNLNDDGACDMLDYLLFGQCWGTEEPIGELPDLPTATSTATWNIACDYVDDGVINEADWDIFSLDWGRTDCISSVDICECDLNSDGKCDMQDYLLFGNCWGTERTTTCVDSDGGKNYYTKGEAHVEGYENPLAYKRYDCCKKEYSTEVGSELWPNIGGGTCFDDEVTKYLYESYCDSSGMPATVVYECEYGCYNGACKLEDDDDDLKKVIICHVPPGNSENAKTKEVAKSALAALLDQGSYLGACVSGEDNQGEQYQETIRIRNRASMLKNNQLGSILSEIKELRDLVREQAAEIKYMRKLVSGVKNLGQMAKDAINNFITYGVDDNTKKLGAGERAAVMNSFKQAFKKLPETEGEFEDAIKIANGRWPSLTSEEAEKQAKERFEKIYKRIADMDDPKDNAAITVMAYGLRQKAQNRNLNSEKQGIQTFMNIFGYHPNTTEDWNIMQAITYSGATRGIDTDKDLLIDTREAELGTDPNNPDTDGDGYLDGIEVANGFDPLNK